MKLIDMAGPIYNGIYAEKELGPAWRQNRPGTGRTYKLVIFILLPS